MRSVHFKAMQLAALACFCQGTYGLNSNPFVLTITHQNDIHGQYGSPKAMNATRCAARKLYGEGCDNAYSRTVYQVQAIANLSTNILNVFAGDFSQGSVIYSVFKSELVVDMMKYMPYDGIVLGDSDFSYGVDYVFSLIRGKDGFICTNVGLAVTNETLKKEFQTLCPKFREVTYDGRGKKIKVGVLGITTAATSKRVEVGTFTFEDELQAVTKHLKALVKKHVNITIVLAHTKYEKNLQLAHQAPHVDIIIGGHSHTLNWPSDYDPFMAGKPADPQDSAFANGPYPTEVIQPSGRLVLVAHMYKHNKYLGVLNVTFNDHGEVVRYFSRPQLISKIVPEHRQTKKIFEKYRRRLRQKRKEVIGETLVFLDGRCVRRECPLGNLFTDAVLWALERSKQASFPRITAAFFNVESLHCSIGKGKVRLGSIVDCFRYSNVIETALVSGQTLWDTLTHSLTTGMENQYFLMYGGIRVVIEVDQSNEDEMKLQQVFIRCSDCLKPHFSKLNKTELYNVASNTYLLGGNYGYTMLRKGIRKQYSRRLVDSDILTDYFKQQSPVFSHLDGRVKFVRKRNSTQPTGMGSLNEFSLISIAPLVGLAWLL